MSSTFEIALERRATPANLTLLLHIALRVSHPAGASALGLRLALLGWRKVLLFRPSHRCHLVLGLHVRSESVDPVVQGRDARLEVDPLVIQLLHLDGEHILLFVLQADLVLGDDYGHLGKLIALLKVHNQLVLPLDHQFVVLDCLLIMKDFIALCLSNIIQKVV